MNNHFIRLVVTLCTTIAINAAASPLPDRPHIYVEGSAEIEVEPDQMTITVSLIATEEDLPSAKARVDANSRTLLDALDTLGIAPRDIATTSLQVRPAYEERRGNTVIVGASAFRQIEVTLRNLEQYAPFIQALVSAEISNTLRTTFSVSNSTELMDEAVQQALADARSRAEGIANSHGEQLGAVYSISEFDLRQDERYRLHPHRNVSGSAVRQGALAYSLASPASEPFEPGVMIASARVYVVYLLGRETHAGLKP